MKKNGEFKNVKAQVSLPIKGDMRKELILKNPPNLKPKNKRAR